MKKKIIIIVVFVLIAIVLTKANKASVSGDKSAGKNNSTNTNSTSINNSNYKGNITNYGNKPEYNSQKETIIDQNVIYMTQNEINSLAKTWYDLTDHAWVNNDKVDRILNSLALSKMQTKAEFWSVLSKYSQLYNRWFTCVIDQEADRIRANTILASKGIEVYFENNKKI